MSIYAISGYPSQTGTAVLRIRVEDLNDNAPEFVLPHPAIVMEGEAPPKHVITFSARDRDTPAYGPPFRFEMVPCDQNPSCDKRTGVLAFNMSFNESKSINFSLPNKKLETPTSGSAWMAFWLKILQSAALIL